MSAAAEIMAAAREEASKFGVSASLVQGSKHSMIEVRLGERAKKFTIELTRTRKVKEKCDWARQNVRRIAKELKCSTAKP